MFEMGKLKLKYIVLLLFFTVEIVPDFRTSSIFWWGCLGLLCLSFLYDSVKNKGEVVFVIKPFEKWYGIFVIYACLSIIWASDRTNTWKYIPTILVTFIVCFAVSQMIRTEEDLNAILFVRFLASFVLCLYIYTNIDLKVLGNERIGTDVLGEGWNSNEIALKLTIGCILGIEQLKQFKNRLLKLCIFASVVAMFSIMMFCGSRTAFIIGVCGIAVYLFLSAERKRFFTFCIIALGVFGMYYLVMNVPMLYDVLGSRLEILESGLEGDVQYGSGTELRLRMMKDGLSLFTEYPIFGAGMNNFRNIYGETYGIFKYSHSNHIEILVNFGIVGALIFYYSFGYLIIPSIRKLVNRKKINKYQVLSACAVVTLILSGFGTVFYMQTNSMLLLTFCFIGDSFAKEKDTDNLLIKNKV